MALNCTRLFTQHTQISVTKQYYRFPNDLNRSLRRIQFAWDKDRDLFQIPCRL